MTVHFQREMERLKNRLMDLCNQVLEQVDQAVQSFMQLSRPVAEQVIEQDRRVDMQEIELEEECLKILALYQPVARDLRFIVCALKMNNDLERIGDLAVNIARKTLSLCKRNPGELPGVLSEMCSSVQKMLRDSLQALVQSDSALAKSVLRRDSDVDQMKRAVRRWAEDLIRRDVEQLTPALAIMAAGRNLERIADHATNLAEDVIYLVEGEIVRHHGAELDG